MVNEQSRCARSGGKKEKTATAMGRLCAERFGGIWGEELS